MAERRTSVAKDALSPRANAILETYGIATDAFNHAREDDPSQVHENAHLRDRTEPAQPSNTRDDQNRTNGSQMVANDQPQLQPRPPREDALPVDRESFDKRWSDEYDRADRNQERGDDYER